jgi:maltooligosyltrehalose trehalohydrolase
LRTFERCRLDWSEVERNKEMYAFHRDLLRLRKSEAAFRAQKPGGLDGAVLSASAFVLRYFGDAGDDRLLVVNLGADLELDPAPEPLLAAPADVHWTTLWSTEDPAYGGHGTPPLETEDNWRLPGRAAVVLAPSRRLAE